MNWLALLGDWLEFLWPFRIVWQYQTGVYYVWGRYWRTVGPGIYPVIPWFMDVQKVPSVWGSAQTPRQDITLRDGSLLTFSVVARLRVVDANLAVNGVDAYMETASESLSSILAEKLSEVDAARLEPEKRGRLLSDLLRWVNAETAEYGVQVSHFRFANFVHKPTVLRILSDVSTAQPW